MSVRYTEKWEKQEEVTLLRKRFDQGTRPPFGIIDFLCPGPGERLLKYSVISATIADRR